MQEYKEKKDWTRQTICVILGICSALILTMGIVGCRMQKVQAKVSKTQQELAEEVFRFHVLANSDSKKDQALKLQVRDAVIAYMRTDMDSDGGAVATAGATATKDWAQTHLTQIEETADAVIREAGYGYRSHAEVTRTYFPDKTYGEITFPEGEYEALRIELGKAKGHNWWCVLYPNLCFTSTTCGVVSDEGQEELKEVLTEDEYEMVTATSDFKIKWFFLGEDVGEN